MVAYFAEYSIHIDGWKPSLSERESEIKFRRKWKECWVEISKECYDKLIKIEYFPCSSDGSINNLEKRIMDYNK